MRIDSSGDLVQLAAYVVIFAVMGAVTVAKKLAEARKRRLAAQQEALRRMQSGARQGLRIEEPETVTKAEPPSMVLTEVPTSAAEGKRDKNSFEDIIRETLGLPPELRAPRGAGTAQPAVDAPSEPAEVTIEESAGLAPESGAESLTAASGIPDYAFTKPDETVTDKTEAGWVNLLNTLDERELNLLQQAIIFSEVIAPPVILRYGPQRSRARRI